MPIRTLRSFWNARSAGEMAVPRAQSSARRQAMWIAMALIALSALAVAHMTLANPLHLSSTVARAQTAGTSQTAVPPSDPPGTIDGAKNPELIPDDVALRMIILAVAEPADAPPEAQARARAKLNAMALSEEDATAFLSLLEGFRAQADPIGKQAADIWARSAFPSPGSTDYGQLSNLGKQRQQLIAGTVAALPSRLSKEGQKKLAAFLLQAKRGMKVFPEMPMPD
jgi:hypothetical protein